MMPNRAIPADVTVVDRFNVPGGQKIAVGFTCSHDFEPDVNPGGESGPLFYAQVVKGNVAVFDAWTDNIADMVDTLSRYYGFALTAETATAMEQARTDACG